ncbi:putative ribonuclease H-like domain-containing protein [Tanacetum coccineum]
MAISSSSSSSSSDSEVQKCSKQCLESFKTLQKNYDTEREKHNKAKLEIRGYEIALESLESRILVHEKNELAWGEKYEFQNYELKCREIKINNLNLELEKVVKERDELKDKIAKWEESSKNLDELLNSQMSARDKTGLGYGTQLNELSSNHETDSENRNFLTPRADISFAGLDEYAIRNKIIESQTTELNTKTSETVGKTNDANTEKPKSVSESVVSNPKINRDRVIIEDWNSDDEEEEYEVQTVRPETQTVKNRDDKSGQNSKKQGIGQVFVHDSPSISTARPVCTARPSVSTARPVCTARPSVSTARIVCTARPSVSTARPVYVTRPIYPRMDNVRPRGSCSPIKRSYYTKLAFRPKDLKKDVKTFGVQNMTTVGIRAVVNTGKGKLNTDLKRLRWGNPEILLQDHVVVHSGCSSNMTGNKAYHSDYEDFNGGFVAFGSDPKGDELNFKLLDESQVVLRAPRKDDVYSLDLKNIVPSRGITCLYANAIADESKLWHMRLGHVNFKNINKLVKGHLVRGLPSKVFVNDHTCVACKKGKQHKASCKAKLERIIRKPLELLHMDLFGPVSVESINKKRYCLVVTDDFSRFSWVFFLATKDETSEILCNLIIGLEKQLNHNVKIIRCDNGTEFKNHAMNEFCAKKGIKREFSIARTPQQNGLRNKEKQTLIEQHELCTDSLFTYPFWAGWQLLLACYVTNRFHGQVDGNTDKGTQDSYVVGSSGKYQRPTQEYILLPLQPYRTRIPIENVPPPAHEKSSNKLAAKALDDVPNKHIEKEKGNCISKEAAQGYKLLTSLVLIAIYASDTLILLPNDGIFNKSYDDDKEWVQWPGFQQHGNTNCCQSLFPTLRIHKIIQKKNSKDPTTQFKQEEDSKGFFSTNKPDKYTSQYRSNKSQDQAKTIGCMFSLSKNPRLITILYKRKAWLKQMHENCFIQTTEGLVLVDLPYRKSNWAHKWGHQIKRDERSIVCEKTKARLVAQGLDRRKVKQQPDGIFISQDKYGLGGAKSLDRKSQWWMGLSISWKKIDILAMQENQMMDYGFNFMNTKIHIDNESTISVIKNPVAHSRTKHIEIRFHFIRDCYEKRLIEVIKIHTDSNVADLLTKGFDVTRFNFLVVSIGMLNLSYEAPLPEGNTSGSAEANIQLKELMVLVPNLVTRVTSLEKELKETKHILGNVVLKLVKKVKSLEIALKRKSKKDIDDDPLVSLFRESMKEKSTDFVTPTKASGEAQEEETSPTILEVAKTLLKVASQSVSKAKSTDKGKRYRRRARSMAKNINTGLDAEDEINTGRVEINTGIEDVNTGSTKVDTGRTSISTSSIILSPKSVKGK